MLDWHRVTRRCVGFEGGEPLNITFTMARPLPIYPLKVPSYLFMPEARSSLSRRDAELIGGCPPLYSHCVATPGLCTHAQSIKGACPLLFFLSTEYTGPGPALLFFLDEGLRDSSPSSDYATAATAATFHRSFAALQRLPCLIGTERWRDNGVVPSGFLVA